MAIRARPFSLSGHSRQESSVARGFVATSMVLTDSSGTLAAGLKYL